MHRVKYQSERADREKERAGVQCGSFFWLLKLSGWSAWALHHFFPAELHLTLLTLLLSPKLIGCQSPWQPGIAQLHYWLGAIHAHLFTQQRHVLPGSLQLSSPKRIITCNCSMFMSKKFANSLSFFFFPTIRHSPLPLHPNL